MKPWTRRTTPLMLVLAVALLALAAFSERPGATAAQHDATASPGRLGRDVPVPANGLLSELAKAVTPAVVNLTTEGTPGRGTRTPFEEFFGDEFFRRFFGDTPERSPRRGLGSGVVIDPSGIVLTNAHLVRNASRIEVLTHDAATYQARIVGVDPSTDLAVLKIQDAGKPLPSLRLGDSDEVRVGEWVLAVGSPFGLQATVTVGIVSAKARQLGTGPFDDFLQTDAAINPGNSGGPLVNMRGEVIGINTAIVAGGAGIGFAIPSSLARTIGEQLRQHGRVVRGWLGVNLQALTPELARGFGLPSEAGALVSDVQPNSPAAKAGLRPGDVVAEFGGKPITNPGDLQRVLGTAQPGTPAPATILREGQRHTVTITVGEAPASRAERGPEPPDREPAPSSPLGLTVEPLSPERAAQLGVPPGPGLLVTRVDPGSAAGRAGLRPGDVIREIGGQRIATPDDLEKRTRGRQPGDVVTFRVERDGAPRFVAITMGRG